MYAIALCLAFIVPAEPPAEFAWVSAPPVVQRGAPHGQGFMSTADQDPPPAAPPVIRSQFRLETRYRNEARTRQVQRCENGVCRIVNERYTVRVPYQVQVAVPVAVTEPGPMPPLAAAPAGPRSFASYGVPLRTNHLGHPGSIYNHLLNEHGVNATGMSLDEARSIHDAIHEAELRGQTLAFGNAGVSAVVTSYSRSSTLTTANRPQGFYGARGYRGHLFDGNGWYPGKGLRAAFDIATPGIGPRARSRRR
jgi:hypothetical protein